VNKNNNVLSYCCSTNKECSSFYSNYILHPKTDHSTTHMNQIIIQCLTEYMKVNKNPPTDIILIKNGSTKYENNVIVQTEVAEIKEVLKSMGKSNNQSHLIYVLLDTNSNQKFFADRGRDIANPQSGMLVNSDAVANGFEFYMVAQQCNRGTVKPTFYKVLYSDSSLE